MSPRLALACGDAVRAALFLALYKVSGARATPPGLILSLAFAAGAVTVFSETALALVVRDVFTGPRLIPANSLLESAAQLGQILGPGGAGLLAARRPAARLAADRRSDIPDLPGLPGRACGAVTRPARARPGPP